MQILPFHHRPTSKQDICSNTYKCRIQTFRFQAPSKGLGHKMNNPLNCLVILNLVINTDESCLCVYVCVHMCIRESSHASSYIHIYSCHTHAEGLGQLNAGFLTVQHLCSKVSLG